MRKSFIFYWQCKYNTWFAIECLYLMTLTSKNTDLATRDGHPSNSWASFLVCVCEFFIPHCLSFVFAGLIVELLCCQYHLSDIFSDYFIIMLLLCLKLTCMFAGHRHSSCHLYFRVMTELLVIDCVLCVH